MPSDRPKKLESIETIKTTTTNDGIKGGAPKSSGQTGGISGGSTPGPQKKAPSPFSEDAGETPSVAPATGQPSPGQMGGPSPSGGKKAPGGTQRPTTKSNIQQKKLPKKADELLKKLDPKQKSPLKQMAKMGQPGTKSVKPLAKATRGLTKSTGNLLSGKGLAGKALSSAKGIAKTAISGFVSPASTVTKAATGLAKNALSAILDSESTTIISLGVTTIGGFILTVVMLGIASFYFSGAGGGSSAKLDSPIIRQLKLITDPMAAAVILIKDTSLEKANQWKQTAQGNYDNLATSVAMELNFLGLTDEDGNQIISQSIIDLAGEYVDMSKIEETYDVYQEVMTAGPDEFVKFQTFIQDAIDKGTPVTVTLSSGNNSDQIRSFVITEYNDKYVKTNDPDPTAETHKSWTELYNSPNSGEIAYQAFTLNLSPDSNTKTSNDTNDSSPIDTNEGSNSTSNNSAGENTNPNYQNGDILQNTSSTN